MEKKIQISPELVEDLLAQTPITNLSPWSSGEDLYIEKYLETICEKISGELKTIIKVDARHYGSGYASFIESWFSKKAPEFSYNVIASEKFHSGMDDVYFGLTVYLSRLSPYFVFFENWRTKNGSGTSGGLETMDRFTCPAVQNLAAQVQPLLETQGLIRLFQNDLSALLPSNISMTTNLGRPPFKLFDAFFYWND